ncbi:methionyl-tRNA synthetase [Babesia ovis]|uniref:methionine--tRNA ligase n=1 Tax=Babesia ovis TaxID=5869 RepID=A0A9W5TE12_BABOV|nr:methionyl-tRNA synthetase [Babesia ovis]
MHILVLDSSLESLIAWSTAEFFRDFTSTILISSESLQGDNFSAVSIEELVAHNCVNGIPLSFKFLDSGDTHALNLFRESLKTNCSADKVPNIDGILSALCKARKEIHVKPLLLVIDTSTFEISPVFGSDAILKHYIEGGSHLVSEGSLFKENHNSQYFFDWLSWSSRLRTLCKKNIADSIKELLSLLETHLLSYSPNFPSLCLGSIVTTLSLLWYNAKLESLGLKLDMFVTIQKFMMHVLNGTSSSDKLRSLRMFHKHVESSRIPDKAEYSSDSLSSVCKDLIGRKYYITTALAYTNGAPHIGHTYEIVTSDIISRYFKVFGMNTTLLAGTDEHGLKVATTAESCGMYPIELADYYSAKFRDNNADLLTAPEIFVRTTEARHYKSAQKIWRILREKGDIYLGEYSGWYNVREETFLTEIEAAATDYKDPLSGKPYTLMKESSYFFRMSKYQQRLIDKISSDPLYLQPDAARSEILSRLKKPLEDLSVSRCNFKWGIPVPDDPTHVMYVWSDALTGYLSGIGFGDFDDISQLKLWPPDLQVIGKDIIWFFAVIWTSILMSLDVTLPKTIFAHGFITAADGRKMSKSLGNVVHTKDLLLKYGVDTLRYYMIRDSVFGSDVKFDLSSLADLHNSDLTDTIGNLVHRITTLCVKFCDGCIPCVANKSAPRPFNMVDVTSKTLNHLQRFALQDALETVLEAFRDTNKYLTDREPWAKSSADTRLDTIRNVLEAIYFLNHLMQPVIPKASSVVFKKLGTEPRKHIGFLSAEYDNLKEGTKIEVVESQRYVKPVVLAECDSATESSAISSTGDTIVDFERLAKGSVLSTGTRTHVLHGMGNSDIYRTINKMATKLAHIENEIKCKTLKLNKINRKNLDEVNGIRSRLEYHIAQKDKQIRILTAQLDEMHTALALSHERELRNAEKCLSYDDFGGTEELESHRDGSISSGTLRQTADMDGLPLSTALSFDRRYLELQKGHLDMEPSKVVSRKTTVKGSHPPKLSAIERHRFYKDESTKHESFQSAYGPSNDTPLMMKHEHFNCPPLPTPRAVHGAKQVVPLSWVKGSLSNGGKVSYHDGINLQRNSHRDKQQNKEEIHRLRTPGTTVLPLGATPALVRRQIVPRPPQENKGTLPDVQINALKPFSSSAVLPSSSFRTVDINDDSDADRTKKSQSSMMSANEDDKSVKIASLERDLITTKVALADSETQRDIEISNILKSKLTT